MPVKRQSEYDSNGGITAVSKNNSTDRISKLKSAEREYENKLIEVEIEIGEELLKSMNDESVLVEFSKKMGSVKRYRNKSNVRRLYVSYRLLGRFFADYEITEGIGKKIIWLAKSSLRRIEEENQPHYATEEELRNLVKPTE